MDTSTNVTTQITSIGNNTSPSFSADGTKVFYTTDRNGTSEQYFAPVTGGTEYPAVSSSNLFAVGDSLTFGVGSSGGGYPAQLSALLNNRTYVNVGVGGQTSTQIAARIGAESSTMTLDNNAIPSSGPVNASNLSTSLLSTPADDVTRSVPGTICSVHGVLERTAAGGPPSTSETYTFTRDTTGQAVACSAGSSFVADAQGYDTWTALIWVGRNNYTNATTVVADAKAIVNWLKPYTTHFAVLSVIKGEYSYEYAGQPGAQQIDELNATLKSTFPDNFIDVESALVSSYNPSLTQDVQDHANNIPPTSLRSDTVHLNDAGYAIVAQQVKSFLTSKNW
ncbi:GDSL-type esterase/lipase family protein [Paraburkholderia sp. HP33-1]|uniref:GDSL-type esterase/lipase family protein n=1 Tax=Paraburkholderia sp. HP33-1 TaxID=2883243 RepID=UPI001F25369B|nr:GDSL-type esterase/lipase family protein [Paraburkholderia sp. HP33-1]